MTTLKHEISIAADIEIVWQTLADLLAVEKYNPSVLSARYLTDQTSGLGAMRRCELKANDWVEERVWEFSPLHAIGFEVAASSWPLASMKWKTELHPSGSATLVTQEMTYQLKFGALGRLLNKLIMRRKLDASVQDVLVNLRDFIESSPS